MSDTWNAIADPTRRKILELLSAGDMNAGEIANNFNMAKSSISHHLTILKNAELIYGEKKGQNVIYSINTTVLQDLLRVLAKLINNENEEDSL